MTVSKETPTLINIIEAFGFSFNMDLGDFHWQRLGPEAFRQEEERFGFGPEHNHLAHCVWMQEGQKQVIRVFTNRGFFDSGRLPQDSELLIVVYELLKAGHLTGPEAVGELGEAVFKVIKSGKKRLNERMENFDEEAEGRFVDAIAGEYLLAEKLEVLDGHHSGMMRDVFS